MDTPLVITGNYGELRPNHFHAGIDFSTGGKIGFPVYAVADGYVSRIKISSGAYGKAVYITHSKDDKLTLYAHFNAYAGNLAAFVKKEQLNKQAYEIEVYPGKQDLKIKKGDLIGYSGNSGSSTGPHLHFEIRDQLSEIPLNPFVFYKINDRIKPTISELGFFNLTDTLAPAFVRSIKITNKKDSLIPERDSVTTYTSKLGFAFVGLDRFVAKGNTNVIFSAKLYLDDKLIYSHTLDNIAFDEQRYVNEFTEVINRQKYQKCFLPTLYPPIYKNCVNKGRVELRDTLYHKINLVINDESGNTNFLQFFIRTKKINEFVTAKVDGSLVDCNRNTNISINGLNLYIPAKTFYSSPRVKVDNGLNKYGDFLISPERTSFRNAMSIGLKVPEKFLSHKQKLVIETNGSFSVPTLRNDSAIFQAKSFGNFRLRVDSIPPRVKTQLSAKAIKKLRNPKSFSFVMRDEMSGINIYKLYINNNWILAEYDAKSNLLTCFLDSQTPAGDLNFKLDVEDRVGNKTSFTYLWHRP
jgi:hypothetical protein